MQRTRESCLDLFNDEGRVARAVKWLCNFLLLFVVASGLLGAIDRLEPSEAAERVIILANANEPESRRLAAYYAEKRRIPVENIVALPMTSGDSITWRAFIDSVYQPLQDELVRRGWLSAIRTELKDSVGRTKYSASGHKMSYLVVCRGVPLRVEHEGSLYAVLPPLTDSPQFQSNSGAVDSELSLLAIPNYPINAFLRNPLFGNDHPTMFELARVVKVSRLDGPSYADAQALIDSALLAEHTGLIGRAYVDIGGKYKQGDDWFEATAQQIESANFDLSVDHEPSTFAPTARFDAPVLYFGWYANDVCGPFVQPEFRFPPGAIALHLHSFSARTLSSAHSGWTGPFVARGVAGTVGNVDEPYLNLTHHPDMMIKAILRGDTWGDAIYYSLPALSWRTMAVGDPLYRPMARSFAQQWENRANLPADAYTYVVLRELRRLEREGQPDEALRLAEAEMKDHPSAPLAVRWAALAAAAKQSESELRAAEWIAGMSAIKPAEIPLAEEAAQILERLNKPDRAADLYARLLGQPALSREFRVELLERGRKAAVLAHRDDLATQWANDAVKLGQGS